MRGHGVAMRVQSEDPGATRRRAQHPEDEPDGGGLAGAVRPEVTHYFAGLHLEVESGQRRHPTEPLRKSFHSQRERGAHESAEQLVGTTATETRAPTGFAHSKAKRSTPLIIAESSIPTTTAESRRSAAATA